MTIDVSAAPQDIVAIFHASFHPTKGNTLDWTLAIDDSIPLHHLEFNALPSGLHLVDQDVIYFTKHGYSGVCIYRRRSSTQARGFTMSSLGILVAKSKRPRPWRHTKSLKQLTNLIYTKVDARGAVEPTDQEWEPARQFFESRKLKHDFLNTWGDWNGWSSELDITSSPDPSLPTLHLSHMLKILGPSSLTLYKHALGRRRILIFTLPPVQPACILCHAIADLCLDYQVAQSVISVFNSSSGDSSTSKVKKTREGLNVLGMITLNDFDMLREEGTTGRGWIACTTDALFLEKPECYDLLVDLTTFTPLKGTRPSLFISQQVQSGSSGRSKYKLSPIRFVWSDIRLWNELDRILRRDATQDDHLSCSCASPHAPAFNPEKTLPFSLPSTSSSAARSTLTSAWNDAWRVYEDVCLICAGLWMGTWRGNSTASYTAANEAGWGSVRLEGDDDLTINATATPKGTATTASTSSGGVSRNGSGPGGSDDTDSDDSHLRLVASSHSPVEKGTRKSKGKGKSKGMKATAPMTASTSTSTNSNSNTHATEDSQGRLPVQEEIRVPNARSGLAASLSGSGPGSEENTKSIVNGSLSETNANSRHEAVVRERQILTTLALLQTFHAHTCFQLSQLERFISRASSAPSLLSSTSSTSPPSPVSSPRLGARVPYAFSSGSAARTASGDTNNSSGNSDNGVVILTAKDVLAFELGPLCSLDAKYLMWLAEEYAPGTKVIVKTTWRDLVGILFGY